MNKSEEYLKQFELALRCKYSSAATIKNYLSCVKRFLEYSSGRKMEINDLVKNYLVWSVKSREPKTINLHRAAIVCFFKLVKGIEIKTDQVPRKKEHKRLPKIIPIEKIIEAIKRTNNLKHKLQLFLFFDCGLRLCEMSGLKKKNIIDSGKRLWLRDTKGNKERIVPVSESISAVLNEYTEQMKCDELVFGGVCKRTFQKVVSNAFVRVGAKATVHMLRHSFATYQISSGENPFKVQQWLGHNSIKTTQAYVHLSNSILSEKRDLIKENYMNF